MWTKSTATFNGKYYQIKDAYCNPKPIQKPHPPIMVGGGGERNTLENRSKVRRRVQPVWLYRDNKKKIEYIKGTLQECC